MVTIKTGLVKQPVSKYPIIVFHTELIMSIQDNKHNLSIPLMLNVPKMQQ